jgi:hypothetical protein
MKERLTSFADAQEQPRLVPVEIPSRPIYSGADEKKRWEAAAAATPRRKGEGFGDWADRVKLAASQGLGEQLSLPRCPGEEG